MQKKMVIGSFIGVLDENLNQPMIAESYLWTDIK